MVDVRPQRILAAGGLCVGLLANAPPVRAEISSSPKGLIGGVMLGAELTVIGEVIAGVETEWLYMAGAAVGGVAGGVGGYFVDATNSPGWSAAMLFGGMALSIPALVLTLDATRRHWPELEQRRLPNESTTKPRDPDSGPELTLHLLPKGGRKLVSFRSGTSFSEKPTLEWAVPDVYVSEAFSLADRERYFLPVATLIQVPVFTATW